MFGSELYRHKRNLASVVLTICVLAMLMLSAPVEAIKVNLMTDKSIYSSSDKVVFTVSIDIENKELVPLKSMKLSISDVKECSFSLDGSEGCDNIEIRLIESGTSMEGLMAAKGFGAAGNNNPETKTTNFGLGYGYGFESKKAGMKGELQYEITWDFMADSIPSGKYEASVEAVASNAGKEFVYMTRRSKSFQIKSDAPKLTKTEITAMVKVKADEGNIILIDGYDSFIEENVVLNTKIRKTIKDGNEDIDGMTTLNLDAVADDESDVMLKVSMRSDDYEMILFEEDIIEFRGKGSVDYYSKNSGRWVDRQRVGYKETERFKGDIDDIYVRIEDGFVEMSSDDEDMPFQIISPLRSFDFEQK